jgi:Holliday junction resolvasome RuvABC endonuclease subunit
MRILGLDLSITSPGFCIMEVDDNYEVVKIDLHGFTKTDKWVWEGEGLIIHKIPKDYDSHPPHYRPFMIYEIMKPYLKDIDYIAVEDYAFGAKGRVFDIAESSGALKNIFYSMKIPMKKFPPMTVKQCATGSGSADKVMMGLAFNQRVTDNLINTYFYKLTEYASPASDLVDAFYMANTLRLELSYRNTGMFPKTTFARVEDATCAIVTGKKSSKTKPAILHNFIEFGKKYK